MELSQSERLWLFMRRKSLRASDVAAKYNVSLNTVSAWLNGHEDPPNVRLTPEALWPWEEMAVLRRRRGWTVKEAAVKIGTSHVSLLRHERGEGRWQETWRWWGANGGSTMTRSKHKGAA